MTLTEGNYFSSEAQAAYMSASQFKAFERCEAAALAELAVNMCPKKARRSSSAPT